MIKFQNVHKTYKNSGVHALRGVSFLIDEGEFVFIIGKSGSGKSTILKCMYCEERTNEGGVFVDGFDISHMSRALVPIFRRQVGMIFQDFRLIETKTIAENIAFAGEIIGLPKRELYQRVQLVLNIVGLKEKADAYPQELSGGEQQRVAIARAMLNNPKIIIADEPTGNLDPANSENIMGLLLDINRSGTTVIVCTHDTNIVDKMKKRVIEIEEGLVVRDKEGSSYADDEVTEEPLPSKFAFGDDRDYKEEADEIPVNEIAPPQDFFFGETPKAVIEAARMEAAKNAALAAASAKPAPPIPTIPFSDDDGYDDEEVAFDDMITNVDDLPVENDEVQEALPAPLAPAIEAAHDEEVPADVPEEEPVSEDLLEKPVTEEVPEEEPLPEEENIIQEKKEEEPQVEEDDSWLDEVRMDDIDLDIQEDDE